MRGYIAPTDQQWFDFHAADAPQREVNFWTPSGRRFSAISPGEPFFFKLKAPLNAIGGFGIFLRAEVLPLWLAWDTFGRANGAHTQAAFAQRIQINRPAAQRVTTGNLIGCRLVSDPVFFPEGMWVDAPSDWQGPIVSGKGYNLGSGEGARVWRDCLAAASEIASTPSWVEPSQEAARFGTPALIHPRLGQGGFRMAVYDAYDHACCVTGEHSRPVLEAAHIKPYSEGGEHLVANGLPLRRDIHRLFDLGYVTVKPDLTFVVGDRLRLEYDNGRSYYELNGRSLHVPSREELHPSEEYLVWHNETIYRAS